MHLLLSISSKNFKLILTRIQMLYMSISLYFVVGTFSVNIYLKRHILYKNAHSLCKSTDILNLPKKNKGRKYGVVYVTDIDEYSGVYRFCRQLFIKIIHRLRRLLFVKINYWFWRLLFSYDNIDWEKIKNCRKSIPIPNYIIIYTSYNLF